MFISTFSLFLNNESLPNTEKETSINVKKPKYFYDVNTW